MTAIAITLDVKNRATPRQRVEARQGETGVVLEVTLNDGGTAIEVGKISAITFCGLKSDGKVVQEEVAAESVANPLTYTIPSAMFDVVGQVSLAYFELTVSGAVVTTGNVAIAARRGVSAGLSSDYIPRLDELVESMASAVEAFKAWRTKEDAEVRQAIDDANTAAAVADAAAAAKFPVFKFVPPDLYVYTPEGANYRFVKRNGDLYLEVVKR